MKPKIFNKVDESSGAQDTAGLEIFLNQIETIIADCLKGSPDVAKVPRDDEGYFYRYDEIMNSVPYSYSDPNVGDWLLQLYWGAPDKKKDKLLWLDIPELGGKIAIATILVFNTGEVGFVYFNNARLNGPVGVTVCTTKEEINFILSSATGIKGLDMFSSASPAPAAAPQDDADHTYDDFFSAVMFESGQDDLDSIEEILK